MFTITIYNEVNHTWTPSILFASYSEAKGYLEKDGYTERNRWFHRESNGWYGYSRAIINPMKLYKEEENEKAV